MPKYDRLLAWRKSVSDCIGRQLDGRLVVRRMLEAHGRGPLLGVGTDTDTDKGGRVTAFAHPATADDGRPLEQELHCENSSCLAFVCCGWDEDLQAEATAAGWTSRPSIPGKEPGTRHEGKFVFKLSWCADCSKLMAEGRCLDCLGTGDQLGPDPFNPPCVACGGTGEARQCA